MNVGTFKHIISIYRRDVEHETVDANGIRHTPLAPVYTVMYASVFDVSGREFYEAMAHQLQNTVTFTMRFLSAVTPGMLVLWDGTYYEIDQVNHLGYKRDFMRLKSHAIEPEGVEPYAT